MPPNGSWNQSIAGFLEDAAKIVKPGRTFRSSLSKPHHHIRVNEQLHLDIARWHSFLTARNGMSLMSVMSSRLSEFTMLSDASGSWGCGALWDVKWFQLAWSVAPCYMNENIATKELIPIVINPRRACAARVTVLRLFVCLSVCLSVTTLQASVVDRTLKFRHQRSAGHTLECFDSWILLKLLPSRDKPKSVSQEAYERASSGASKGPQRT